MPDLIKTCKDFFIKSLVLPVLDYFNLSHMYQETADEEELEPMLDKEIPRDVHFVLINSGLLKCHIENIYTWLVRNEDYSFHLWVDSAALNKPTVLDADDSDDDLAALEAVLGSTVLVSKEMQAMTDFCNKHEIILHDIAVIPEFADFTATNLRMEILYRYGGVYSAIDLPCLSPLGQLANKQGFFAWSSFDKKEAAPLVADNRLIAVTKQHDIIAKSLRCVNAGI